MKALHFSVIAFMLLMTLFSAAKMNLTSFSDKELDSRPKTSMVKN